MSKKKVTGGSRKKGKKKRRGMRKKRFERRVFATIVIALTIVIIVAPALFLMSERGPMDDPSKEGTSVYFEGSCLSCKDYVKRYYVQMLEDADAPDIEKKDFTGINAMTYNEERNLFRKHYKVPEVFTQPIEVFVVSNITTIFIGDAPWDILSSLLSPENQTRIKASTNKILFYTDEYLEPHKSSYVLWGFKGEPKEYPINTSIDVYLDYFEQTGKDLPVPDKYKYKEETQTDLAFLAVVTVSGFLDGINPCAIAILIFFITFLYTTKGTRAKVTMMGSIYILAIFTIYFLIGLGIFAALSSLQAAFIITMIGAIIVIILGFISMRDYLFPHLPFTVEVPQSLKKRITKMIQGATLPTTLVIGLVIGAYTFPCSGAIYVVIISLLAVKTNFLAGLGYLLWYNLWFVMPLIIILAIASNRNVADRMKDWERKTAKKVKAFSGLVMIALGVFIIVWYVIYQL
jgi:cytochrome c biogenesis protein CcdA